MGWYEPEPEYDWLEGIDPDEDEELPERLPVVIIPDNDDDIDF